MSELFWFLVIGMRSDERRVGLQYEYGSDLGEFYLKDNIQYIY